MWRGSTCLASSEVVGGVKTIDAHAGIHLRCGASEIRMHPDGTIKISGKSLLIEETETVRATAPSIDLNP